MKRYHILTAALLISFFISPITGVQAQSDPPIVHAVLFYSPTCGHCEFVINGTILPLIKKYGEQLQIIALDVTQQRGNALFLSSMQKFNLDRAGVPFLVIDNTYLIGSADIPEKFPGLIETYLNQGGVGLPDIPGLREAMAATDATQKASTPTVEPTQIESNVQESAPTAFELPESPVELTWQQKFAQDPEGNTLSVIVLVGMIGAVIFTASQLQQGKTEGGISSWDWFIPILCVVGFGVAGYLAFVEMTQVAAVCGPVGDCNTVQQSEYARLFGILPIGVMGLAGYVAIFTAWLVAHFAKTKLANLAALAMFGMAIFGTLFSIFLTFLEPFVIGATCVWCLTSAIITTTLMLLSLKSAKAVFS